MKKLEDSQSAVNLLVGRGFIEAAFARWTLGDRVYGDRNGGRFLKRLKAPPPEIWEIRVTEPNVQARILGRFAAPDTVVVTDLHTRQMLGRRGSQPWIRTCAKCVSDWTSLFGELEPYSGRTIHDYVTENCDDFPLQ